MALIDFSGFDNMVSDKLPPFFTSTSSFGNLGSTTNTRYSIGTAFNFSGTVSYNDYTVSKSLPSLNTVIVGFAAKANYGGADILVTFGDSIAQHQSAVLIGTDQIHFCRYVYFTTSSYIITPAISHNQNIADWHYYEIKAQLSNTAGSFVVRIDGKEVVNISGIDNINTSDGDGLISLFSFYDMWGCYIDDIYVCDDTGDVNNDFLGEVMVGTLYPSANGTINDGTASTGDNYECVNEVGLDTSDYVTLDAVSEIELYTFDDLPSTTYTKNIHGVKVGYRGKLDSAGIRSVNPLLYLNSTNYIPSSNLMLGSDFDKLHFNIWELNPDTSSAWAEAEINALEAGVIVSQ